MQYNHSAENLEKIVQSGFWSGSSVPADASEQLTNPTTNPEFFDTVVDHLGFTEPYFAALGEYLRIAGTNLRLTWVELSLGSGPKERFFAVSLGYLVLSLLFSIYLNLLNVGNVRSTGIAVRNAVRQQLLVLKVSCFLSKECMHVNRAPGCCLYFHRIGVIPAWLWYRVGSVHCMAFPRGGDDDPRRLFPPGTIDRRILPLACRHDVHVGFTAGLLFSC